MRMFIRTFYKHYTQIHIHNGLQCATSYYDSVFKLVHNSFAVAFCFFRTSSLDATIRELDLIYIYQSYA